MSVLSSFAGNEAPGIKFEHGGKAYEFRRIDNAMMLDLENHLYEKAFRALMMQKEAFNAEQFEARLETLSDGYEAGLYAFESKRGMEYLKSAAGILYLASLITGAGTAELVNLMQDRGEEVMALIKQMIRESFPALKALQTA